MKFPSYITWEYAPNQHDVPLDQIKVLVHVRRWHPGWWLVVAQTYWRVIRKSLIAR